MTTSYYLAITTRKPFKELTHKAKRNTRRQIHNELDYTGNFKLKTLVSAAAMNTAIIVIPFKSRDQALDFRECLKSGMHPERYKTLKIVGRLPKNILKHSNVVKFKSYRIKN